MKRKLVKISRLIGVILISFNGLKNSIAETAQWQQLLVEAARERTEHSVVYSGKYMRIDYPGGDVPDNIGVCTDVIVRSYRQLGVDLQVLVHKDMSNNFAQYPEIWGLKKPDTNIDHRRVPNLQVFFKRFGKAIKVSQSASSYQPGDIVSWMLSGNLPHIGIVSDRKSADGKRNLIIHNIGSGPREEDFLFAAQITGHYRYELATESE